MPELWGGAAGQRMAEQDAMAQRMNDINVRRGEVALQSEQLSLAQQQQMQKLMQESSNGEAPKPEDLAVNLDKLAGMAAQSGMIEQAKGLASTASTIRHNLSTNKTQEANHMIKLLDMYANALTDVKDEQSWKQANALFKMQTGEDPPFADQSYSPELMSYIKNSSVTMRERASLAATAARVEATKASEAERVARKPLIEAQTRLANARTAALEKTGAKPPKAQDLKIVTDHLMTEYNMLPEEARIVGRPVAERMLELIKAEPGLTPTTAGQKAYQEAFDRGDFGGFRLARKIAGSQAKPIPMPADKTTLKSNMYYMGTGKYAGVPLLWTGTGFRLPEDVPDEDDEEDEEDEE